MSNHEKTKTNDFIEIKFSGYANNELFDSNIEEDLKKINEKAKADKLVIVIGQGMVVKGLDKELENKDIDKEYEVNLKPEEGFGHRNRNLIKTIPLSAFTQQKISPRPGMVLALDNQVVKIIAVSGARVITDFNNPLADKSLKYKFRIIKKVDDEKDKIEALFKFFLGFIPEFEISGKIIVKGNKNLEAFLNIYRNKFKELLNKDIQFEETEDKKVENENQIPR